MCVNEEYSPHRGRQSLAVLSFFRMLPKLLPNRYFRHKKRPVNSCKSLFYLAPRVGLEPTT